MSALSEGYENMNNILSIRDGLHIIGPLKTTGEGSVYKAQRADHSLSAVKVLAQPLSWEKIGDESLNGTRHELSKLKKLGEYPHNNVVRVVDTGLTKSGDSFYVEMDFIEGADLEQLLEIPDHSILTITEALNLAEQLCNALEHCHKMDVVHGGVKLSNVKWNTNTGNYLLVDLGLSVMQELQRRSRIPKADQQDLAAPEEQAGKLSFQTDVYRFGLILFRLLTGTYPRWENHSPATNGTSIPLKLMPDVVLLRQKNIPSSWIIEKDDREKVIPKWLVAMVYKCLETDPAKRFVNGMELREYLNFNLAIGSSTPDDAVEAGKLRIENEKLAREKRELQAALQRQEFNEKIVHRQWREINELVSLKDKELEELKQKISRPALSGGIISVLIVVAMLAGAFASYLFVPIKNGPNNYKAIMPPLTTDTIAIQKPPEKSPTSPDPTVRQNRQKSKPRIVSQEVAQPEETLTGTPEAEQTTPAAGQEDEPVVGPNADLGEYKVKSKAYFHDEPDESTRRRAFIIHWNNAVIRPIVEKDSYIYVVFTNHLGQTSKGWLNKNELTRIN